MLYGGQESLWPSGLRVVSSDHDSGRWRAGTHFLVIGSHWEPRGVGEPLPQGISAVVFMGPQPWKWVEGRRWGWGWWATGTDGATGGA